MRPAFYHFHVYSSTLFL